MRRETSSLALGMEGGFGTGSGPGTGLVVAALNAASAAWRGSVGRRVRPSAIAVIRALQCDSIIQAYNHWIVSRHSTAGSCYDAAGPGSAEPSQSGDHIQSFSLNQISGRAAVVTMSAKA